MDIRLENLSIGYKKGGTVASGINATFRGGELTCLIGSNGIGKSTLLKTISGYLPARSGSIWFADGSVETRSSEMSQSEMARTVSIVLTAVPNVQNLTVTEMVGMGRSPYTGFWGTLSDNDKEIVSESIASVGIVKLSDRMIQTLSDGERQKVMIARALAQQTPVILLDEPTAFLDFPSKAELMKLLARLAHEQGKNILLSTHDLSLAVRLADRLFLFADGQIRSVSSDEVKRQMAQMLENKE